MSKVTKCTECGHYKPVKCERCGHDWTPKKDDVRVCPKCQSPWWDTPKEEKGESKDADNKG